MSNLEIKITAEMAPLETVVSRLQNSQVLYKIWANRLEAIAVIAFKNQVAPWGLRWEPLAAKTLKQKKKKSQILRDTGTLYSTVAARALPDGAVVGTNQQVGSYSLGAIHQFGAPRARIPARPFLPMDSQGRALPQLVESLQELTEEFFRV